MTKKTKMNNLTVLKSKKLIDGKGNVIDDALLFIEGKRIKKVGKKKNVPLPANAEIIDMQDCTLMPGLIDAHLHLASQNVLTSSNFRISIFEVTPQMQMFYSLLHAQLCFEMGFTTLRDMGWATYQGLFTAETVAIRDAINTGVVPGPRILVSGWAAITGGHFDLLIPRNALRQPGVTADGPWELRKLARTNIRAGCDLIKTCITGGGGTDHEEPTIRNMTQEELNAIVDEAHAFNKMCACHCFTPESQRMAIEAGVDTLEHCVFTDDKAVGLMREHNKYIIPTLAHRSDKAIEIRRLVGGSEFSLNKMKRIQPHTWETFKKCHQGGVKIAMGTDTNYDPAMGDNAYELEIYVNLGMTPMEAILTATKNAAEALRMDKDIGTLEEGKLADIIAVEGDPLKDITVLQKKELIKLVAKEGKVYVDRRPRQNKYVIHNDERSWQRTV